jgi:ATP-dependent DNA ligase
MGGYEKNGPMVRTPAAGRVKPDSQNRYGRPICAAMRKVEFLPCIPTPGTKVPAGPDWIHEIKQDGIVQREGDRVRLFTKNGHDWSGRYPRITETALTKHRERPYRAGPSQHWIKVKNRTHPALARVKEAFS